VIDRPGVRVQVHQVLRGRVRISCTGCPEELRGDEGWIQRNALVTQQGVSLAEITSAQAAGDRSRSTGPDIESLTEKTWPDPISTVLAWRKRWASGEALPEGATPGEMCFLVDQGLSMDGAGAISEIRGGLLAPKRRDQGWYLAEVVSPDLGDASPWACDDRAEDE
jgi:hypothetical protein